MFIYTIILPILSWINL